MRELGQRMQYNRPKREMYEKFYNGSDMKLSTVAKIFHKLGKKIIIKVVDDDRG